jgi:tRNA(Met) cytidine acetyltransferase
LLLRLLRAYPRIAFTTTVHGYEGTGRGFLLRFVTALTEAAPERRLLRLETPVRWAPDDPLERLSFRLLLLAAEAAPAEAVAAAKPSNVRLELLDRDALGQDESELTELFGLLWQAHYRTRPFDLRHLLDGPNVEIYVQRHGGRIVSAALLAQEGGLERSLSEAILRGERRVRGHLLPQSLAFHLGQPDGALLRCYRVMRLAVHPACRQRGLGRSLLAALTAAAASRGFDLIGSSFGGNPELLRFWQQCGFAPVRVGMTRSSSSGEHALMVLRSLNTPGAALLTAVRRQFLRDLPAQLGQPLRDLDADLALQLLQGSAAAQALDTADLRQLQAFAFMQRSYGDTIGALQRLVLAAARAGALDFPQQQRQLLLIKVLQGRSWSEAAASGAWSGRAAAETALRQAVAQLLQQQGIAGR